MGHYTFSGAGGLGAVQPTDRLEFTTVVDANTSEADRVVEFVDRSLCPALVAQMQTKALPAAEGGGVQYLVPIGWTIMNYESADGKRFDVIKDPSGTVYDLRYCADKKTSLMPAVIFGVALLLSALKGLK